MVIYHYSVCILSWHCYFTTCCIYLIPRSTYEEDSHAPPLSHHTHTYTKSFVMLFWAYTQPSILHIHTWCILNHNLDNNSCLLHAFSRKWYPIEVTSFPQLLCPTKPLLSQASRPTLPPTLGQMESSYNQWDKWVRFPRIEEASGNVWDSGISLTYIVWSAYYCTILKLWMLLWVYALGEHLLLRNLQN